MSAIDPTASGVRRWPALSAAQAAWRRWLGTPWEFRAHWPVAGVMIALAVMTLVFRLTPLDLAISRLFYDAQTGLWPWFAWAPCTALYRYGIYPPLVLAACGGVLFALGWLVDGTDSLARAGLFLGLVMLIGPALIVNVGFKNQWGRARPNEVQEFGGLYLHTLVGSPGGSGRHNSSFPSGHAAQAFYLMAPAFLVSPRRPRLCAALFAGGILYGLCMSATRVAQGGHFTSDVLWSGGIVYLVCALVARLVLREPPQRI